MGIGAWWHWLVVLLIVVLVFGTKKLKNFGSDVGGAVKGFKEAMNESSEPKVEEASAPVAAQPLIANNAVTLPEATIAPVVAKAPARKPAVKKAPAAAKVAAVKPAVAKKAPAKKSVTDKAPVATKPAAPKKVAAKKPVKADV